MTILFDETEYRELEKGETYENKYVIICPQWFGSDYREALNQLFLAKSGFGCDPKNIGTAVFGSFWDESARVESPDILGVATDDAVEKWERLYNMKADKVFHKVFQ